MDPPALVGNTGFLRDWAVRRSGCQLNFRVDCLWLKAQIGGPRVEGQCPGGHYQVAFMVTATDLPISAAPRQCPRTPRRAARPAARSRRPSQHNRARIARTIDGLSPETAMTDSRFSI